MGTLYPSSGEVRACGGVVFVLVPTGAPASLRFGHPDVTTDDTAPQHLLSATSLPPGSVPDQYAKPSQPGTDQPTHQPAHQRPGPAE